MDFMSRHGLVSRRSRHGTDVTTLLVGNGCRDMGLTSRPSLVVQEVATWPRQGLGQFGVAPWALGRDLGQAVCTVLSIV